MKTTKIITILIFGFLIFSPFAQACRCIEQQLDILYYNKSQSIFTGKLVELESKDQSNWKKLKFKIIKSFKGIQNEYITVYSPKHISACGLSDLNIGDNWLIYTFGDNKAQMTNRCSLSKKYSEKDFTNDTIFLNNIFNKRNDFFKSTRGEGNLLNGEPDGLWKYFTYNLGKEKHISTINYNKGIEDGIWISYDKNGKIEIESMYKKGKVIWQKNYNERGNIIYEIRYNCSGKREKITKKNYDDGTPRQIFKEYYLIPYTKFEEYYPNGQLKKKGNYRWDKWKYYSEKGELIKKGKSD